MTETYTVPPGEEWRTDAAKVSEFCRKTSIAHVTVDDVFKWGDELGRKAKEVFGGHFCDVSNQTFSDIKKRCDKIDVDNSAYMYPPRKHLNLITLHVVTDVPDGLVRQCTCRV